MRTSGFEAPTSLEAMSPLTIHSVPVVLFSTTLQPTPSPVKKGFMLMHSCRKVVKMKKVCKLCTNLKEGSGKHGGIFPKGIVLLSKKAINTFCGA